MAVEQFIERLLIVGGIFPDSRVGTATGFYAENAVLRQYTAPR